jgi:hypothetical protein
MSNVQIIEPEQSGWKSAQVFGDRVSLLPEKIDLNRLISSSKSKSKGEKDDITEADIISAVQVRFPKTLSLPCLLYSSRILLDRSLTKLVIFLRRETKVDGWFCLNERQRMTKVEFQSERLSANIGSSQR